MRTVSVRRILFDQNTPVGLRRHLFHDVSTAFEMGWSELENGRLLAAAEGAGFDVLVTCDQSLRYQQNLSDLRLGIVVLSTNKLRALTDHADMVMEAIEQVRQGGCEIVRVPRPPKRVKPGNSPV